MHVAYIFEIATESFPSPFKLTNCRRHGATFNTSEMEGNVIFNKKKKNVMNLFYHSKQENWVFSC